MMEDIDYGDASRYANDAAIEMAWATKAAERANVHMNLLMCCDTRALRLNKLQDVIHTSFRNAFPDLDVHKRTASQIWNIDLESAQQDASNDMQFILIRHLKLGSFSCVTEVELKQGGMKEKWHDFCEYFKELVEDYSLGTLMRMEACKCYSEENTIVVPKIIYLAVEIARNIEGINEKFKAEFTEDHKRNGAML